MESEPCSHGSAQLFNLNSEVESRNDHEEGQFPFDSGGICAHKIQLRRSWISTIDITDNAGHNLFEGSPISEFRIKRDSSPQKPGLQNDNCRGDHQNWLRLSWGFHLLLFDFLRLVDQFVGLLQ